MFNKRGQELSTGTIILLILGVIILVLLALGFTSGWGNLGSWLGRNNADAIVSSCNAACVKGGVQEYCLEQRDLYSSNVSENIKDVTCNYLVKEKSQYALDICGIDCNSLVYINGSYFNEAMTETQLNENCQKASKDKIVQYLISKTRGSTLISHRCTANETK